MPALAPLLTQLILNVRDLKPIYVVVEIELEQCNLIKQRLMHHQSAQKGIVHRLDKERRPILVF